MAKMLKTSCLILACFCCEKMRIQLPLAPCVTAVHNACEKILIEQLDFGSGKMVLKAFEKQRSLAFFQNCHISGV